MELPQHVAEAVGQAAYGDLKRAIQSLQVGGRGRACALWGLVFKLLSMELVGVRPHNGLNCTPKKRNEPLRVSGGGFWNGLSRQLR